MLCLQLQRVRWTGHGSLEKLHGHGHVAFPQCLDLSASCRAAAEPLLGDAAPTSAGRERAPLSAHQQRSVEKFALSQERQEDSREGETVEHGMSKAKQSSSAAASPAGCEAWPSEQRYRLAAVIVHHGTARSGHYSTYRRLSAHAESSEDMARHSMDHGSWVCVSDEDVRKADVREVLACQASILFYEKVPL